MVEAFAWKKLLPLPLFLFLLPLLLFLDTIERSRVDESACVGSIHVRSRREVNGVVPIPHVHVQLASRSKHVRDVVFGTQGDVDVFHFQVPDVVIRHATHQVNISSISDTPRSPPSPSHHHVRYVVCRAQCDVEVFYF